MAAAIDLYLQPGSRIEIEEIVKSNGFEIDSHPSCLARGQIGTLHKIAHNKESMTITLSPETPTQKFTYLLCLAAPRSADFLIEVTDLLAQAGAERTPPPH